MLYYTSFCFWFALDNICVTCLLLCYSCQQRSCLSLINFEKQTIYLCVIRNSRLQEMRNVAVEGLKFYVQMKSIHSIKKNQDQRLRSNCRYSNEIMKKMRGASNFDIYQYFIIFPQILELINLNKTLLATFKCCSAPC